MGTEIVTVPSHELNWKPEAVAKFLIGERTGKKAEPTEVMGPAKDSNVDWETIYLLWEIFSQASKLAVEFLVLLLSEVSRQINMIVKTRLQEKTLRVYLVTRFCLKPALSVHIQSLWLLQHLWVTVELQAWFLFCTNLTGCLWILWSQRIRKYG